MKLPILIGAIVMSVSAGLLSGCAGGGSGPTATVPSLGAEMPQTGRLAPASNVRATGLQEGARMSVPVR